MKRSVIISTLVVLMSLVATSMFAVTVPSPVNPNNVTATVVGSCKWTAPFTIAFGSYDPFAVAPTTTTATVNFKCVKKTQATDTYQIWFNKTAGNMAGGGDVLAYTLTSGGVALPLVGAPVTVFGAPGVLGAGYSFVVDGSIASGQDVVVAAYADTVIANIEY